jgi:hypothetical protein
LWGVALFAGYALIGPSIALPLYWLGYQIPFFLHQVVYVLWPMWGVAAAEHAVGAFVAATAAVLWNVGIFGFIGLIGGLLAGNAKWLSVLFLCVVVAQMILFRLDQFNPLALIVAWGLFALPFVVLARIAKRRASDF